MVRGERGFTLIELLIVIAIIAIIASIAIPNLLSARVSANETSAIATLRNISSAQAQYQSSGRGDRDGDGEGEYGYFSALSGFLPPRGAANVIVPPALSGVFQNIDQAIGIVTKSGYIFQMFLPGMGAAPEPEAPGGGELGAVDDNLSEGIWACYAWPAVNNNTGNRVFMINQSGDVLSTDNTVQGYSGTDVMPNGDAVYTVPNDISSPVSINGIPGASTDMSVWRPAS